MTPEAEREAGADDRAAPLVLIEDADQVRTVRLNRPDRLNALDPALLQALIDTWAEARDPEVRAVVITGEGRGFCSGVDLRGPRSAGGRPAGPRARLNPNVLALASLDKPVIAAVNGVAAGAGLALACAADIRIASSAARFVPAFTKVGVTPDAGASYFLPRLLGPARAFEWLVSGDELDADAALQLGLVSEVVAPEELAGVAHARAATMASMPGRSVALTKVLVQRALTLSLAEQLELEAELQLQAIADPGREQARAAVVAGLQADDTKRPGGD